MATKRIFLLDGHSLAYRAFYALPTTLATSTGQVTNAAYGFTSMLVKLLAEEHPDHIAVAFDKGKPTARLEVYAEYKAGRAETPDEFRQQLPLIQEVLQHLRIPIVMVDGHEADDAIATLARRAVGRGMEAVVVTADRDFFQLVSPGIRVMFNRKGISDIVWYDEQAVLDRFGVPPERYVDLVALKGDPSDNIPGVPGVGEKTAARLIQRYGSVEGVLAGVEELTPKLKASIAEAGEDLRRNKGLARLRDDLDLDVQPEECVVREWDPAEVRRLFNALEFRTLYERLEETGRGKPVTEASALELEPTDLAGLNRLLSGSAPRAIVLGGDGSTVVVGASPGGGQAVGMELEGVPEETRTWLADPQAPKWVHDGKALQRRALELGLEVRGVSFDTLLAGYLLDPADPSYPLSALCERYLGANLVDEAVAPAGEQGTLALEAPWRASAAAAGATALLAPVLTERVGQEAIRSLLEDVELPLSRVLARMEARGITLDVEYLRGMSEEIGDRMKALEAEIHGHAGEEFNLNSPPQLRVVLFDKLGLTPGKRTKTGYSTDADTLEKLRQAHPIVDALLEYRELSKLKSTYLDALPPLVQSGTGRIHTTFNQVAAATGRLSSLNPNLQNIPVRGDLGKKIRTAFVPAEGHILLVADYSQIELRVLAHLSGDRALAEAFAAGEDIHAATAARVYGLPLEQVEPEMRRFAKTVNYGLAYGMNAYGLGSRLGIPPDEARAFIEAYFAGFPSVRDFLDRQVDRATADGFTSTILGRRRYLPELQSPNPRIRDLGRRMALNAPIQGSAADIIKLAMIEVDRSLGGLPAAMLLTVHDELVFEVAEGSLEQVSGAVREVMEGAYELSVPLAVDLGSGPDWGEAAPAGH